MAKISDHSALRHMEVIERRLGHLAKSCEFANETLEVGESIDSYSLKNEVGAAARYAIGDDHLEAGQYGEAKRE